MCNLYTWKMTAEEMRALKLHFQFIGTTWPAYALPLRVRRHGQTRRRCSRVTWHPSSDDGRERPASRKDLRSAAADHL
jgi:hypothetical protein